MSSEKLLKIINTQFFLKFVICLIALNSIILGAKTYPSLMNSYGAVLMALDNFITILFVLEVTLYLFARGVRSCFTDVWYLFDFTIVFIAAIPTLEYIILFFTDIQSLPDLSHFAALRAVRVLRILRLITIFPNLRKVILGLLNAIPGISSIGAVLMIIMYTSAIIATQLYSSTFPEYFGTLQQSAFSLFQIMTVEGWPDIARKVIELHPNSWIFFVSYILITAFIIINLFVAVIVEAIQKEDTDIVEAEKLKYFQRIESKIDLLREENKSKNINK